MPMTSRLGQLLRGLLRGPDRGSDPWPFVPGKYQVVDATASVVVTTLGNHRLASDIAAMGTPGLCMTYAMTGKAGEVAKLARTLATNLSVQWLLLVGAEGDKEATELRALFASNAEEVADALGRARIPTSEIMALRKQVQLEDMLGCTELDKIATRIRDLSSGANRPETGFVAPGNGDEEAGKRVIAADTITHDSTPDKAGQFKIDVVGDRILVEHYDQKEEFLRVIEGTTARSICLTLVRNGWVSKLDHAAYLGRELARAEAALMEGAAFQQDAVQGTQKD